MDLKALESLGLTQKEADVYLILINLKSASIADLIKKSKIAKQSVYEILERLLDKGLVSFAIKDGKKQYIPANPERLRDIVKEKEAGIEALLPELLNRYNENKEETNAELFLGKEGMKTIMNNILKVGKPVYALSNKGEIFEFLKYYMPQFMQKRMKANIFAKIIFVESARNKKFEIPLSEVKYISDDYNSPVALIVYGDNINYLIYSENPIALHIQSKEIAQSFTNYFNLMWSISKK